jgi:hypothetical protein
MEELSAFLQTASDIQHRGGKTQWSSSFAWNWRKVVAEDEASLFIGNSR